MDVRLRLLLPASLLGLGVACSNPPPTCVPGERSYRICSDDQVWECPQGSAEQIAKKQMVEAMCNMQPNPVQCILDTEQEMVTTTLVADCAGGGQICKDDPFSDAAGCADG